MADRIDIFQVTAQVEWQDPPLLKVGQVIAQVEYGEAVLVTLAGTAAGVATVEGNIRGVSIKMAGTVSSAASVSAALTGGALSLEAATSAAVSSAAGVMTIVPGIVSIPVVIVVTGGVKVGGDATIVFLSPYAPTVTGGVEVGGETEPVFTRPTEIIAEGGVVVGGYAGITFELPPVVTAVAEGGVLVGGEATVAFSLPTTFTWVAQGGVVVSGGTEPVTTAPTTYVHVVTGGVKVGGPFLSLVTFTDPPDLVVTPSTAAVALEVGGEAAVAFTRPEVVDVSSAGAVLVVGGAGTTTFIHPMILEVIAEGEITVGAEVVYDEPFDTWTLNGSAYEPSVWTGWNFNSFAVHRGQAYGAGEDGIYLLEGSDDDGQKIHTGMRVGPVNFGSDKNKRLRSIHGAGWGSNVKVRVSSNGFSGIFRPERDPGRVSISRDIIGSSFTIELSDFESLSQLEITPLVLARR